MLLLQSSFSLKYSFSKTYIMRLILFAFALIFTFSACNSFKRTQDTSILEATNPPQDPQREVARNYPPVEEVDTREVNTTPEKPSDATPGRTEEVVLVNEGTGETLQKYYVIVGSFGVLNNAKNFNQTLKGRGFNSTILMNNTEFYRVSVGGHQSEQTARQQLAKVKSMSDYKDAWLLITK